MAVMTVGSQPNQFDPSQIEYLRDVLGIIHVMNPKPEAREGQEPQGVPDSARLVLLVPLQIEDFPLHGDLEALFERMLRAMKLERAEVWILAWRTDIEPTVRIQAVLESSPAGRPILLFGEFSRELGSDLQPGKWRDVGSARLMPTFALRDLLTSPERKKSAWVHLQDVMKVV